MNKKIAVLLFAIGLGSAASVSAFQLTPGNCSLTCQRIYQDCMANGYGDDYCGLYRLYCLDRCEA